MEFVVNFRKKRFLFDLRLMVFTVLLFGAISYLLTYVRIYPAPFLFGILLFIAYPWLWRIFCVCVFHQPALVLNSTGIRLFPVHIPGNFFISWSEIQKISVEKYNSERCICIYPKNGEKYLAHLSPLKRIIVRLWRPKGQVFISISLLYLDKPAVELFQQLSREYAIQLHQYDIQIQF